MSEFRDTKHRNEEVDQCPRCEMMAWEAIEVHGRAPRYLSEGVLDCPECNATVFVRKDSESGTAELLEGDDPLSVSTQVRECLTYDAKKGTRNGSGGAKSRKKPALLRSGNSLYDDSSEWNTNDAVGIVSATITHMEYSDDRADLMLHDRTFQRLLELCKRSKDKDMKPSEVLREAIRYCLLNEKEPYKPDFPGECFGGDSTTRYELRLSSALKSSIKSHVSATGGMWTISDVIEDMVLLYWSDRKYRPAALDRR